MRILISGAGIAGPALAWHLGRVGADVTVLDRTDDMLATGHNIDAHGSALRILKEMGLYDELLANNTTERGTRFIEPAGKRAIASFPVAKGHTGSLSSEFEILRGDLAAMLYRASKRWPSVRYVFDTTVTTVEETPRSVRAHLSDGTTAEFDVLVAADGQWSKIRRQCFGDEAVRVKDFGMFLGYFTIPRQAHDLDWWSIYMAGRSRTCTIRPDPHGTMRAMLSYMPPKHDVARWVKLARAGKHEQTAMLQEVFHDAGWETPRLLKDMHVANDFYFQAVQRIELTPWHRGRVVCIGDAAFAPTPLTGMGTSLAIISARLLAGELSRLASDEHPGVALERYESVFRPFVEKSQKVYVSPRVAHPAHAWTRWLTQSILRVMAAIVAVPWLRERLGSDEEEDFALPTYAAFEGEKHVEA